MVSARSTNIRTIVIAPSKLKFHKRFDSFVWFGLEQKGYVTTIHWFWGWLIYVCVYLADVQVHVHVCVYSFIPTNFPYTYDNPNIRQAKSGGELLQGNNVIACAPAPT